MLFLPLILRHLPAIINSGGDCPLRQGFNTIWLQCRALLNESPPALRVDDPATDLRLFRAARPLLVPVDSFDISILQFRWSILLPSPTSF
jgi:hypothetical protein